MAGELVKTSDERFEWAVVGQRCVKWPPPPPPPPPPPDPPDPPPTPKPPEEGGGDDIPTCPSGQVVCVPVYDDITGEPLGYSVCYCVSEGGGGGGGGPSFG